MKRKIMFVLASLLIGCSVCFAAPEVKTKKIKYASNAYYEGEVLKKTPQGKGKVIINEEYKNRIEITGQFNDIEVTEGEVAFVMPGVTYKGSLSIEKKVEMLLIMPMVKVEMQLKDGAFYDGNGKFIGTLAKPLDILFDCSVSNADMGEVKGALFIPQNINEDYIKIADAFIGTSNKKLVNASVQNFTLDYAKFTLGSVEKVDKEQYYEYDNGVVLPIKLSEKNELKRANGDFIVIDNNLAVLNYKLVLTNATCTKDSIIYTFANSNVFKGKLSAALYNADAQTLSTLTQLDWKWEDFCKYALEGKLTYADGTYYVGNFSSSCATAGDKLSDASYNNGIVYDTAGKEISIIENGSMISYEAYVQREAERKAQAEREEAERKAQAEKEAAERKAKYEAAKAKDYYKLDETAVISEFVITYPDMSRHEYVRKGDDVVKNKISYADGRIVNLPFKWKNDDYSQISKYTSAFEIEPRKTFFDCTYPDGFKIKHAGFYYTRKGSPTWSSGMGYYIYEENNKENGDYSVLVAQNNPYFQDFTPTLSLEKFRKKFDEYTIVWDSVLFVEFNDGTKFKGKFEYVIEGESKLAENPHILELDLKVKSSLDNVVGAKLIDGEVYTKAGDVVAIYRNEEKLEGFDYDQELAQIKLKIAEEKKKIEEQRKQKEAEEKLYAELIKKYGKKYVDLALLGRVEVGMPFDLVNIVATVRLWSVKLTGQSGGSKIYDIKELNANAKLTPIGYIRVANNKVQSVYWW